MNLQQTALFRAQQRGTRCRCGTLLTGGIDTFGPWNDPLCWECYSGEDVNGADRSHYGLAPHRHDLSKTGSFIGSTVFETDREDVEGFVADPDAPELGFWTQKPARGWR
jgi:hypothetical protein